MTQPTMDDDERPPREYGPLCDWVGRQIADRLQALEPAVYAKEVSALAKRPELLDELASAFTSMLTLKLLEGRRQRRIKRNERTGAAPHLDDPAIRSLDTQIDEIGNEQAYWALEATLTRVEEEVGRDVNRHPRSKLPGVKSLVHATRLLEAIHGLFPGDLHQALISDLLAFQLGGPVSLLKKQPTATHGDGSERRQLQIRALEHIAFRRGTGMKEERAQEVVTTAYGIDMDTIRQWRKRLRKDRGAYMAIHLEEVTSHGGLLAELRELKAEAPEFTTAHEVLLATLEKRYGDETLARDGLAFAPYRHGAKKAKA